MLSLPFVPKALAARPKHPPPGVTPGKPWGPGGRVTMSGPGKSTTVREGAQRELPRRVITRFPCRGHRSTKERLDAHGRTIGPDYDVAGEGRASPRTHSCQANPIRRSLLNSRLFFSRPIRAIVIPEGFAPPRGFRGAVLFPHKPSARRREVHPQITPRVGGSLASGSAATLTQSPRADKLGM